MKINSTDDMPREPVWALADFMSSYRYWALFLACLFVSLGEKGLNAVFPLMLRTAGATYQIVGLFYVGVNIGWIFGAFVALVAATRHSRSTLIWPSIICTIVAVVFLQMPALLSSPTLLFFFGVGCGAIQAAFPLAAAIFLVGGHPNKIDYGGALIFISTPILAASFASAGAAMLTELDQNGALVLIAFAVCQLFAVILLLSTRRLGFDDAPRQRHRPLQPRRRSPLVVAAILFAPPLLLILLALGNVPIWSHQFEASELSLLSKTLLVLVFCMIAAALVYLGYWIYRIHGELASVAPSQRLLTPRAAVPIAMLVPLGLPVLLVTLGDFLNDHARDRGQGRSCSIAWLVIWALLLPPAAIAMVQNAANRSYRTDAPLTS